LTAAFAFANLAPMMRTVKDLADLVGGEVRGDGSLEIVGASPAGEGGRGQISFVDDPRHLPRALKGAASCLVLAEGMDPGPVTAIVVAQPKLAFARMLAELYPPEPEPAGTHESAVVDVTARLGSEVHVGPHAVIAAGAVIGDRVSVGAGATIGRGVQVGDDSVLFSRVVLYPGTVLGKRVRVHAGAVLGSDGFGYVSHQQGHDKFPQVGGLEVGDDVEIGANTTVDRGALGSTRIGAGTKIDNLVQIAHNVQIGARCLISAQTGIAGSSVVEDGVILAGQVGIADHVRIKQGAIVGAQGGVPTGKIIREGRLVWGTPARLLSEFKLEYAHLRRLPKLAQRVEALEQRLAPDEEPGEDE
jgi:UDP-3-O-[3-hydroxymyristoyl] glucosamine N-acyltransferase